MSSNPGFISDSFMYLNKSLMLMALVSLPQEYHDYLKSPMYVYVC